MAKKRKGKIKVLKCKKCEFSFEVGSQDDLDNRGKTWPFVAPMPDKDGNVTITQMAVWKCPKCGYTIRGSIGKTKGQFEGKSKKLQIEEKLAENIEFDIEVFANSMGAQVENLEKILVKMIEKGMISGKIVGEKYIP